LDKLICAARVCYGQREMATRAAAAPQFELAAPPPSRRPLAAAAVVGLAVTAGVLWMALHPRPAERPERLPPLTPEAQAYLPQLEVTLLQISRWENFLGQEVIYLDLRVANRGAHNLTGLEVRVEFAGADGGPVRSEVVRVVGPSAFRPRRRLGPNEAFTTRAAFDDIPKSWNGQPPRVTVSGLVFE
jgi:hypothetical protein